MRRSYEEFTVMLSEGTRELGITLKDPQIRQFFFYLQELQKWNKKINLVGNDDTQIIVQAHFVDSLSCLLASLIRPNSHLLDIGTGAGFPGIPLKISDPSLQVTVVDAVSKKIMFLRHLCRVLNLHDVTCIASRVERLSSSHSSLSPESCFDIIVSRAVGTIPHVLHLAAPFLAPEGHVLLQRGHKAPQEIHELDVIFRGAGFQVVNLVPVKLSFFANPRYLVLLSHLT